MSEGTIWKEISDELSFVYGHIILNADGYKLSLHRTVHKNRLIIEVYINDRIKGEWLQFLKEDETPCEEARRFYNPVKDYIYTRKFRKEYEKKLRNVVMGYHIFYRSWWSSAIPMIRHLKKTCKSVTRWSEADEARYREQQNLKEKAA